jgi:UDP-N-acetyl-2-amino-2-deoxyglucuronate dehydrogenase
MPGQKPSGPLNRDVGVAVVGLGFGASRCPMIKAAAGMRLAAVCSRDPDHAAGVAGREGCAWASDYRELLRRDDVDVIAVYTPSAAHHDIAIEAAEAGKHVLVSKPLETTLGRAADVAKACEQAGVLLVVEFDTRYARDSYRVYQAIADGRFGRLVQGEYVNKTHRDQGYYESGSGWRRGTVQAGGGCVINQGIHALDQMIWYQGEPDGAFALAGRYAHDIDAEDGACAAVRFRDGSMAVFEVTTTFHNDRPRSRYGEGTMKRAEINGVDGSATLLGDRLTLWRAAGSPAAGSSGVPDEPASNVFEDLSRTLAEPGYTSPTLVSGSRVLDSMRLAEAIYASIEHKTYVKTAEL